MRKSCSLVIITRSLQYSADRIFACFSEAAEGPEDPGCGELRAAGVLV